MEKTSIIITHWIPGTTPHPVFWGDAPDESVMKAINQLIKERSKNDK